MSTFSDKVCFIKTLEHKPLCGRRPLLYAASTRWRDVTCKKCLRVHEHSKKVMAARDKAGNINA